MPALVNELPQLMTKRFEIRYLAFDPGEMKAGNAIDFGAGLAAVVR